MKELNFTVFPEVLEVITKYKETLELDEYLQQVLDKEFGSVKRIDRKYNQGDWEFVDYFKIGDSYFSVEGQDESANPDVSSYYNLKTFKKVEAKTKEVTYFE